MTSQSFRTDSDVLEELPEYRPLSVAAIAACVLTVPGFLGAFHSAFLIFPIVAIVLALFALRRIATAKAGMVGRRAALAAIFGSVLLIGFTVALHSFNSQREYYYAAGCVEDWLRLLRGENPTEAYLLTLAYDQRPGKPGEDVQTELGTERTPLVLEQQGTFLEQVEIAALANPNNQVKLAGLAGREFTGQRAAYRIVLDLHAPKMIPQDYYAVVEALRMPGIDGGRYWQIGGCQLISKHLGPIVK